MDSPFEILLVDRDADEEEIEQAYRERVKETHPDQGGSVEEFRQVRKAYEELVSADGTTGVDGESEGATEGGASDAGGQYDQWEGITRTEYLNYEALEDYGWSVDDDGLFEKAADAGLDEEDYGEFGVEPGESLLEAAERRGFAWPYACRGGACVNCAVYLVEGEISMPINHVLPDEMLERGFRLSCNGIPVSQELKVVYNVKHVPALEELLLPPRPFEQAHLD